MGFLKKLKLGQKKREKEVEERVERFKEKVNKAGKEERCAIVPIITKYGLENEIQVLPEKTESGIVQEKAIGDEDGAGKELIEEGHSEDLAKKV